MATRRSSLGTTTRLVRRTLSRAGCCRYRRRDSERRATSRRLMELENSRTILRNTGGASMLRALIAAFLSVTFALAPASAQDWPSRNINVIVPLGAGSASDILARVVMDQVGRQLGHNVIVENRPGAGGTIGANMVAKAAPDGYTVLAYGALASAHALYSKLPYDTLNDLIPVASLGQQPLVVVVSPAKGYKTLADLVAAGKGKPGAL